MTTYEITILLSQDFRSTCFGYDPSVPYEDVSTVVTEAESVQGALNLAYAIFNSYPDELHCPERYLPIVAYHRTQGHRSLSVGDVITVHELEDDVWPGSHEPEVWAVASVGFERIGTDRLPSEPDVDGPPRTWLNDHPATWR